MLDRLCALKVGQDDGKLVAAQARKVQTGFFQRRSGDQVTGAQLFLQRAATACRR
jgi:hypothetical protein